MNIINYIVETVYPLLLAAGLVICWRTSFSHGLIFFLIMLVNQGFLLFSHIYVQQIADLNANPIGNMTIGSFIATTGIVSRALESVAVIVLIVGLYKHLRFK